MSIDTVMNSYEKLSKEEEFEFARIIEAGVYAEHLLDHGNLRRNCKRAELQAVADAGRRTQHILWLANLRLVAKIARITSNKHGLPYDDLFQEGCLGLAEAIIRFDYTRGHKFSTLAHTYITRRVTTSAAFRAGAMDALTIRLRHQARLRDSYAKHIQRHEPSWKQVAATAGLSPTVAARANIRHIPLDETHPDLARTDQALEAVDRCGVAFLELMSTDGELLRLRYGINGPAKTLTELAEYYGVSASTVARMEERALERARGILSREFCRQ